MQQRLESLLQAVAGAATVLILPHNDPDPDAIAAAVGLRHLLVSNLPTEAFIGYDGIIGRAENRALEHYLGHPLRRLSSLDLSPATPVALVDTQPSAGNNALPADFPIAIVIDHHERRDGAAQAAFADVRPHIGATSTMIVEYLRAADVEPTTEIATALFYGLKTDTMRVGQTISPADADAYLYLQPRLDIEALHEIERAQVPADYFKSFAATLGAARVYNDVVISYVGEMAYPDQAAELADMLLRLQGTQWVICMGVYKSDLILAARARGQHGAGRLVRAIVAGRGVAGGHNTMAGGRIQLNGRPAEKVVEKLRQRALLHLNVPPDVEARPLI